MLYVVDMDVGITALRANLADWLQKVREGEEITITDHGVPVARLVPAQSTDLIERLTREGVLGQPTSRTRRSLRDRSDLPVDLGVSLSDIIIQQRGGDA
ncbi:MAG: type II toxin-antitoxin system prevent-host-death family antitoxin [Actinomycetota bacterium]|nr:type II toxin-antitoxin system prevent-host-death family antitoxin [Actinomycetota bacterium]